VLPLLLLLVLLLLAETPANPSAAKDIMMTNSRYMFVFIWVSRSYWEYSP